MSRINGTMLPYQFVYVLVGVKFALGIFSNKLYWQIAFTPTALQHSKAIDITTDGCRTNTCWRTNGIGEWKCANAWNMCKYQHFCRHLPSFQWVALNCSAVDGCLQLCRCVDVWVCGAYCKMCRNICTFFIFSCIFVYHFFLLSHFLYSITHTGAPKYTHIATFPLLNYVSLFSCCYCFCVIFFLRISCFRQLPYTFSTHSHAFCSYNNWFPVTANVTRHRRNSVYERLTGRMWMAEICKEYFINETLMCFTL